MRQLSCRGPVYVLDEHQSRGAAAPVQSIELGAEVSRPGGQLQPRLWEIAGGVPGEVVSVIRSRKVRGSHGRGPS